LESSVSSPYQLFLDYEPRIHYIQFQIQAGTTGIYSIRIYSPIKRGLEHDPQGIFIKKWFLILQAAPHKLIYKPYNMSIREQGALCVIIGK